MEEVLLEFVKDVEAAGGIAVNDDGCDVLVCDPGWVDLAVTYRKACLVLNRQPLVALEDDDDEDNDDDK